MIRCLGVGGYMPAEVVQFRHEVMTVSSGDVDAVRDP
jgi:hypothetical protein